MIPNFWFFPVVGMPFANTIFVILVMKGLQSRWKWSDQFYRQKGVKHAVDDMCHSLNFVAAGIVSGYTMGGLIHILLVIAIVVVVIQVIQGRR